MFTSEIGVAGSDLITDGGTDLLKESIILISLTSFPEIVDVSICEGIDS